MLTNVRLILLSKLSTSQLRARPYLAVHELTHLCFAHVSFSVLVPFGSNIIKAVFVDDAEHYDEDVTTPVSKFSQCFKILLSSSVIIPIQSRNEK